MSRPFSMIPALTSQMSAAMVDPRGPRLGRATVAKLSATKRTAITDGIRAVHSFCCPKILNEAATSLLISGGGLQDDSPPASGPGQWPASGRIVPGKNLLAACRANWREPTTLG